MAESQNRGTASGLGAADLPQGYRIEGDVLITPSGLRVAPQSEREAVDISNRSGNTVHIPYTEWEFFSEKFVMPTMSQTLGSKAQRQI